MSTTHELSAEARTRLGTGQSRKLRSAGKLPAVLYGHRLATMHLTLDAKQAVSHIMAGEKLFEITIDDGAAETALLKDIAYDHLGSRIIHADFERVNLDETVTVTIPVHLKGDAVGLKSAGAILIHPSSDITVVCRVRDLRDSLDYDISELKVGESLHAGQIPLPARWVLQSDADAVVAAIQTAKEEAVGEEVEVAAGEAQPEVITEKKDNEKESKE